MPTDNQLLTTALEQHQAGRLNGARELYERILKQNPDQPDALHLLGLLIHQTGRPELALPLIQRAVALNPSAALFHNSLGEVLRAMGRVEDAMRSYRQSIALNATYADPHLNLGAIHYLRGEFDEATEHFAAAARIAPNSANPLANLGLVVMEQGYARQARSLFEQALKLQPNRPDISSNLLLSLLYDRGDQAEELKQAHQRWSQQFAKPVNGQLSYPHSNSADPDRPLRIGLVSRDFKSHPVGSFVSVLTENLSRAQFIIFCFSDVVAEDQVTERIRRSATFFHKTAELDDANLALFIRDNQVDILIDLAGHTAGHRLLTFARRPAPIQCSWLGYPHSTGLAAIDYRISDNIADPPAEIPAGERDDVARLERCFLCYRAPADAPAPSPPPALSAGRIAFGSFNNLAKLSDATVSLWSRLLKAVPDSQLVLKARALAGGRTQQRTRERFAAHGIAPERIELLGQTPSIHEHLAAYSRVDIALDPYPYCGTTTTCEALHMGVPVVSPQGPTHVSRVGASLLNAAGLGELVAGSPEEFLHIAAQLASDRGRLSRLRSELRGKLQHSALCDEKAFAAAFESMLRSAWRNWCSSRPPDKSSAL